MNRDELLKSLTELDFMAVDLALYLNTHPTDATAIAEYNKVIQAADTVREKYEELYGPVCSFRSYARDPREWKWIQAPWPWDASFNYEIPKEGCR